MALRAQPIPVSRTAVEGLEAYDRFGRSLLQKHQLPGLAIAISRNGRLVYACGFGYADREHDEAVQPQSLFRIASISKPVTAVMILKLVERGALWLEQRLCDLLPGYFRTPPSDKRQFSITVRHLLEHTGGWDRQAPDCIDPMFRGTAIAECLGERPPATADAVIRYMMTQTLQFTPGTRHAYSNYGYCLLGRIIEHITGKPYEQAIREEILQPAGIHRMRLGRTLPIGRRAGEVKYYSHDAASRVESVFPGAGRVAWPYGAWHLEAMDSHGGWIASVIDLVRFADALDGRAGLALLGPPTLARMIQPPAIPHDPDGWYAKGWDVRRTDAGLQLSHTGSLDGTISFLARVSNGFSWAVLTNTRPSPDGALAAEMNAGMWAAFHQVRNWPDCDQYPAFEPSSIPRLACSNAVVNAASLQPGAVPGSWAAIQGESLDGVEISFNGHPPPLQAAREQVIYAQVPAMEPGRWIDVSAGPHQQTRVLLERHAPDIFPDLKPAAPGRTAHLHATGVEPSPAGLWPVQPVPVRADVQVFLDTREAEVLSAFLVLPGVFRIDFKVPALPAGPYNLTLVVNRIPSHTGVTFTVSDPS